MEKNKNEKGKNLLYEILISGRVQGVGYRYFTLRQALFYGIKGTVQNLFDGRVKVIAQGERIIGFINELRKGPSFSQVDQLEEKRFTSDVFYEDFRII